MKKIVCLICTLAMIVGVIGMIPASAAVVGTPSKGGASPIVFYDNYWGHIDSTKPPKKEPPDAEIGVNENGLHTKMGYFDSPKDPNFHAVGYSIPFLGAVDKKGKVKNNWFLLNDEGAGIFGKKGDFNPADPLLFDKPGKMEYLAFTMKMRTVPGEKVVIRPKLVFTINPSGDKYEFDWMNGKDGLITIDNTAWKPYGAVDDKNVQGYFDVRQSDFDDLFKEVKRQKQETEKKLKAEGKSTAVISEELGKIKHGFQLRFYNESKTANAWLETLDYDMWLVTVDQKPAPNANMVHPSIPAKTEVTPPTPGPDNNGKPTSSTTSTPSTDSTTSSEVKSETRIIGGTVVDKDGKAIADATVKFGETLTAKTDKNGKFNLAGVAAATYKCVITDKSDKVLGEQEYVVEFGTKPSFAGNKITTDAVGASLKIKVGADKKLTTEIDANAKIEKPKDNSTVGGKTEKTNSLMWIWFVVGGIVVLAGLFCLYWFVIRPKMALKANDDDNKPDDNDSAE